ncbi:hypothetical protein AX17_005669 [Amanita inopinata Kibby_2008]|nr:hypothetical protein AX17_005669 [Amanita inopinata Kibby_2008]
MVAHNPLFQGKWTAKRYRATVINDIWPEVLFFTLIAIMVTLISEKTEHQLTLSTQLLTVLGTVLGLVISFRTSSAYERYQDGRKMWTNISVASRNLAQQIWLHVPFDRQPINGTKMSVLESTIEKRTMINMIQAFSVSVKHFLRGEQGIYYEDLYPLISFLPKFADSSPEHRHLNMLPLWSSPGPHHHHHHQPTESKTRKRSSAPPSTGQATGSTQSPSATLAVADDEKVGMSKTDVDVRMFTRAPRKRSGSFDPEKALPFVRSDRLLRPARNPPSGTIYDYFPLLRVLRWMGRTITRRGKKLANERRIRKHILADVVESNIPLEIFLYLSNYTAYLMRSGLVQPAIATGVTANLNVLHETTAQLERIRNTPLPFAYQAHLRMSLWLYLVFLPFQIYASFKWFTIPGTAFASFLLLGFLEIGQEIENPFNYDLNDLDMDGFCLSLQRDLHEITTHAITRPSDIIFSEWNQPFAPADRRSAQELVQSLDGAIAYHPPGEHVAQDGYGAIRRTLVKSWREVEDLTREFKE